MRGESQREPATVPESHRSAGEPTFSGLPGTALPSLGDYEVLEEIARGGMGVVYRARQTSLNRPVALKMILTGQFASATEVQRFRLEAEAAALMDHPNIVPVYEVGEYQGSHYFTMKLVEGGSLAQNLELYREPRVAARLLLTVARAVHYAHQRGILHRDLKPGNILLQRIKEDVPGTTVDRTDTPSGSSSSRGAGASFLPMVADFGLAKRVEGDTNLTQSGALLGTPNYMAPEQALGKGTVLTTAVDVHALGAILYELLTRQPPFQADTALDTLTKVREEKPASPRLLNPRVDADLATICLKCLEKEPAQRYGSAAALAEDLERWLAGEVIAARRTGLWTRCRKWAQRRPALATIYFLAGLVLLLGGAGSTAAWLWLKAEHARRTVEEALEGEKKAKAGEVEARRLLAEVSTLRTVDLAYREWKEFEVERARQLLASCPPELRRWEWGFVNRLCHADLFIKGHNGAVRGVAFSADGRLLASASYDDTIKVWDARNEQLLATFKGDNKVFTRVFFTPDGRVAGLNGEFALRVWDVKTKQEVLALREGLGAIRSAAFSHDGKQLATAGRDGAIKLRDPRTGKELRSLKGHPDWVNDLCFSPDSKRLASAGEDATVKVWDVQTGRECFTLRGHSRQVWSVCFSPDGKRLASTSFDDVPRLWDAVKGQFLLTLRARKSRTQRLCFSPDGTRLATADDDRTARVWDAATGEELRALRGNTREVADVCWSPDGQRLAAAGEDGTVRIWDAAMGHEALILTGHRAEIESLAFSPDNDLLAGGAGDTTVRVWSCRSRREVKRFTCPGSSVWSVAFSPDGKQLAATAAAGLTGVVRLWDARTWQEGPTLIGHAERIAALAYSPDGKRLATASDDRTVKLWDPATGQVILTLKKQTHALCAVCFSPDGKLLATAARDHSIVLWDVETGQMVRTLRGHTNFIRSMAFSPDGLRLASGSWDTTVKLWDVRTGAVRLVLRGHTAPVQAVAFSPDGSRLVSAGIDRTVKLWEAGTGLESLTLTAQTQGVNSVCFSPDGMLLATGGYDSRVKVWDATPLTNTPGN